eukprot:g8706.t1
MLIPLCKENEIVVKKKNYQFGKVDRDDFIELLNTNKNLYEVLLRHRKRRLYFDLDNIEKYESLETVKSKIKELVGDPNVKIAVSGSVATKKGKEKHSYHIVCPDIVFKNLEEMETTGFAEWAVDIGGDNVYKKNQAIKCVNQKKEKDKNDDRIQRALSYKDNLEYHLISVLPNTPVDPLPAKMLQNLERYIDTKKQKTKILETNNTTTIARRRKKNITNKMASSVLNNIKLLPERYKRPVINLQKEDNPIKLLKAIANVKDEKYKLGYEASWTIMLWFKSVYNSWKKFKEWYKPAERNSPMSKQHWDKRHEYHVHTYFIRAIIEKQWGKLKRPEVIEFKKQFYKGDECNTPIKQQYMEKEHLKYEKQCQLIKMSMGGGKTFRVAKELNEKFYTKRILWITNRVSMAKNLAGRLKEEKNLNFQNYKDIINDTIKENKDNCNFELYKNFIKNQRIQAAQHLIIELESLYRTTEEKDDDLGEYDIVVLDEIESMYHSFSNDTCHNPSQGDNKYDENYEAFESSIRNAKQLFVMDAYLHKRTEKYLKLVNPDITTNLIIRQDKYDKNSKKQVVIMCKYAWLSQIVSELKENKKLYIYYPYKTGNGRDCEFGSILNIKETLKHYCNLRDENFKLYYSNSDATRHLDKINTEWADPVKCVLTTSTLTVGVNYECEDEEGNKIADFDNVYLLYTDFILPRDVIQTSYRVRQCKNNNIYVAYEKPKYGISMPMTTTLSSYVTSSALTTSLADYSTTATITSTLANYITSGTSQDITGEKTVKSNFIVDLNNSGELQFYLNNGLGSNKVTKLVAVQHASTSTPITLSLPSVKAGATSDQLVSLNAVQTLTGKTFDYNSNTFQNFPQGDVTADSTTTFTNKS